MTPIRLLLSSFVFSNFAFVEFTVLEQFYDREAYEQGKALREIKPKHCPDGSEFGMIDFEPDWAKVDSEVATCFYLDDKNDLSIDHVWVEGVKTMEYSEVNGVRVGPEVIKPEGLPFLYVSEICSGIPVRTEVIDSNGKVLLVFLFLDESEKPSVIINFEDPSKNESIELISEFKPCDFTRYKIENEEFNKWLNRAWFPLPLQPPH